MIDFLPNFRLLTWWHKSAALAGITLSIAVAMAFVGIGVANSSFVSLQSKTQFCLWIQPLVFLLLMGGAARLQQKLNRRGGIGRQTDDG